MLTKKPRWPDAFGQRGTRSWNCRDGNSSKKTYEAQRQEGCGTKTISQVAPFLASQNTTRDRSAPIIAEAFNDLEIASSISILEIKQARTMMMLFRAKD